GRTGTSPRSVPSAARLPWERDYSPSFRPAALRHPPFGGVALSRMKGVSIQARHSEVAPDAVTKTDSAVCYTNHRSCAQHRQIAENNLTPFAPTEYVARGTQT